MKEIREGDEVRIFEHRAPEGGWAGKVTKVARKYATVEYEQATTEFDMGTGIERGYKGNNSTYATRVKTLAEVALDQRRSTASQTLFRAGVSVNYPHRLSLEQLEALAEVAGTFPELDRGRL